MTKAQDDIRAELDEKYGFVSDRILDVGAMRLTRTIDSERTEFVYEDSETGLSLVMVVTSEGVINDVYADGKHVATTRGMWDELVEDICP